MKYSIFKLIREEFPGLSVSDAKALTAEDRLQLASAIVRQRGISAEALDFVPVEY